MLDKFEAKEGKTKEIVDVVKNLKKVLDLKEIKKKVKKEDKKEKKEDKDEKKPEKKAKKFDIKNFKLSLLLITPKNDKKIVNASKNLSGFKVITADSLNVVDLLKHDKVLLTEGSLEVITKTYLK